jgi:hypothetical protein
VTHRTLRSAASWVLLVAALAASRPVRIDAQESREETAATEGAGLSFLLHPLVALAFGSQLDFLSLAAGSELAVEYRFPFFPYMGAAAVAGYRYVPLTAEVGLNFITAGGRLHGYLGLAPRLLGTLAIGAGYAARRLSGPAPPGPGDAFYLSGTLRLDWLFTSSFAPYVGLGYDEYFGLYRGGAVLAGVKLTPRRRSPSAKERKAAPGKAAPEEPQGPREPLPEPLESEATTGSSRVGLSKVRFDAVFPVLYRGYESRPIGTAVLQNRERDTIRDVVLGLHVDGFMDHPRLTLAAEELGPRQSATVEVWAWFDQRILSATEAEEVPAQITLSYDLGGERREVAFAVAVPLRSAHAVPGSDARAVGAFVTPGDPAVAELAGTAAGIDPGRYEAVDANLQIGLAFLGALAAGGIRARPGEDEPEQGRRARPSSPATVQFPRETLEQGSGSSVDLAVLYASLLEAAGIESALIFGPGEALAAFTLRSSAGSQGIDGGLPGGRIIRRQGSAWVPVRVDGQGGFLHSVQTAAERWQTWAASGAVTFVPVREAWRSFPPVQPAGPAGAVPLPTREQVVAAYTEQMRRWMLDTVAPLVSELKRNPPAGGDERLLANRIGVLYARHGLYEEAGAQFQGIEGSDAYVPGLVNLGHLAFLEGDPRTAIGYYERALALEPGNQLALLALARVHYALEDYEVARGFLQQLREINALLAGSFSYLEREKSPSLRQGSPRARERQSVLWAEE